MKHILPLLLILCFRASAATLFVYPEDNITDSLQTLSEGDTLFLMPGTYINTSEQPVLTAGPAQSGVTITSSPENRAVLDGQGLERSVVTLNGPHSSRIVLENLVITGGNATGSSAFNGGGLSASESNALVNNCLVIENTALIGGGIGAEGGTLQVQYSTIRDNTALVTGGGLDLYATQFCGFMLHFFSNTSSDDGGGLNAYQSTLNLSSSLFTENYSGDDGGAVTVLQGTSVFSFLTVHGNEAFDDGGGFRLHTIDSVSIVSSIVTSNLGKAGINVISNNTPYIANTCCWNNTFSNYHGMNDPTGTEGNISENPEFADSNYNLSQTVAGQPFNSPALNAGHAPAEETVINSLSTRTDSLQDEGIADMGFHHLNSSQTGLAPQQSDGFAVITLSPSPASNRVRIALAPNAPTSVTIQVFDIAGRLLHSFEPVRVTGKSEWLWHVEESFPGGLVLIQALSESGRASAKVVVIR